MATSVTSAPFSALVPKLSPTLIETLTSRGFTNATPVQEATIPRLLRHQDVVVQAATGSGKTLAFLIPLLEIIGRREDPLKPHQVGAIIVEPTRELAVQVNTVFTQISAAAMPSLTISLMVGGTDIQQGMATFREQGGHVLIGTPGRLNDLMERLPEMSVRELELLVLDEADRLLDMGFENTLNAILGRLPKQRRTGLFSATQTAEVLQLVRAGLRNPVKVEVKVRSLAGVATAGGALSGATGAGGEASPAAPQHAASKAPRVQACPSTLSNHYMVVDGEERLPQLVHFLRERLAEGQKLMVYFLTCACVDYYSGVLPLLEGLKGANIRPLHGKMAPKTRTKTYEWFQKGHEATGAALLCTDVAARGLDIPDVDWIVQFDAPQDPNAFVHRVGRTARMGRAGRAVLFLRPHEDAYVHFLHLRKVPLHRIEPTDGLQPLRAEMTKLLVADRALMEGAAKAFVAYVRAYKEHQCGYIFRLEAIDLGALARALAVLRLPKLKEISKMRSKARRKEERAEAREAKEAKALRKAAIEQRKRDREREKREAEEEADLAREASLMKKLKRGKITQAEFDRLMGEADDDDELGWDEGDEEEDEDGGGKRGGDRSGAKPAGGGQHAQGGGSSRREKRGIGGGNGKPSGERSQGQPQKGASGGGDGRKRKRPGQDFRGGGGRGGGGKGKGGGGGSGGKGGGRGAKRRRH